MQWMASPVEVPADANEEQANCDNISPVAKANVGAQERDAHRPIGATLIFSAGDGV